MANAFLHGGGAAAGFDTLSFTNHYENNGDSTRNFTFTHSGTSLFTITVGCNDTQTARQLLYINNIRCDSGSFDGNYSKGTYMANIFLLVRENGGLYDVCRLNGEVIFAGVSTLTLKTGFWECSLTEIKAA